MKKLVSLLCMAACVFSLCACSTNETTSSNGFSSDEVTMYQQVIEENLSVLSSTSDAEINTVIATYGSSYAQEEVDFFTAWMAVRPEVGDYIGIKDCVVKLDDKKVVVTADVDYSLKDCDFTIIFNEDGTLVSTSFGVQYSKGEIMKKAALNTLIGISTVFIVLILIAWLISLFKYINKIEQALKNKKENKQEVASAGVDNAIAQITQNEEEELVDDYELVAVISAAIAAYEGTSSDGFVVRSIKKANKRSWKNA